MAYPNQQFKNKKCKLCSTEYIPKIANSKFCGRTCKKRADGNARNLKYNTDVEYRKKRRSLAKFQGNNYRKIARKYIDEIKNISFCALCGESHFAYLSFHHLNKSTKRDNFHGLLTNRVSMKIIKEEISKCIILYENCHRKYHYAEKQIKRIAVRATP